MPGWLDLRALVASAVMAATAAGAWGQAPTACVIGAPLLSNFHLTMPGMRAMPYSVTVKESSEQTLADGNSIRTVLRTRQARDSAGRVMDEMPMGCERGKDGQTHALLQVHVYDAERGEMIWLLGDYVERAATRFPAAKGVVVAVAAGQAKTPTAAEEQERSREQHAMEAQMPPAGAFHEEDLGTRSIDGVEAQGHRSTRTIAAGEAGNAQPISVVRERWFSAKQGLLVREVEDDPRRGRTTVEIEDLRTVEPDPAMFAPPAGYTERVSPP